MIGTDCCEAALGYVRRKAVVRQVWLPGQNALSGLVHGRYGEFYMPTVYFSGQGPMLGVRGAQCSCDAHYACEHAAALLVSAVEGGADTAGMPAVPRQARRPPSARAVPDPREPAPLLLPRRTFYRAVRVRVGPALAAAR